MALKEANLFYTVLGNVDIELEAKAGDSLLVKDILVFNPVSNYMTVKTDKVSVWYGRIGGTLGSHHGLIGGRTEFGTTDIQTSVPMYKSILKYLMEKGIFTGFPISEGRKMTIDGIKQAGAVTVIVYDKYDAGDQLDDMPNGPEANEYLFINYGNCGASITDAGDHEINTPKNPGEFMNFPFGDNVPSRYTVDLLGILASDFAPSENDGTDDSCTKYLKMFKDRDVLFDEDRNGLLCFSNIVGTALSADRVGEGQSIIGNLSTVHFQKPFEPVTPLSFVSGEELTIYWTLDEGGVGQAIAIDEHEIGLIMKVTIG